MARPIMLLCPPYWMCCIHTVSEHVATMPLEIKKCGQASSSTHTPYGTSLGKLQSPSKTIGDDLSDMDAFHNIPINFITNRDALLMTLIWIRQYPLLEHIAKTFYTTASTCHKIIWHCLIQLHILLANEIQWHNDADWMQLTGKYEDFISLATMID